MEPLHPCGTSDAQPRRYTHARCQSHRKTSSLSQNAGIKVDDSGCIQQSLTSDSDSAIPNANTNIVDIIALHGIKQEPQDSNSDDDSHDDIGCENEENLSSVANQMERPVGKSIHASNIRNMALIAKRQPSNQDGIGLRLTPWTALATHTTAGAIAGGEQAKRTNNIKRSNGNAGPTRIPDEANVAAAIKQEETEQKTPSQLLRFLRASSSRRGRKVIEPTSSHHPARSQLKCPPPPHLSQPSPAPARSNNNRGTNHRISRRVSRSMERQRRRALELLPRKQYLSSVLMQDDQHPLVVTEAPEIAPISHGHSKSSVATTRSNIDSTNDQPQSALELLSASKAKSTAKTKARSTFKSENKNRRTPLLSRTAGRSRRLIPFPQRVHHMICDLDSSSQDDGPFEWSPDGIGFTYDRNHPDIPTTLSRYFAHDKISSFRRLLNAHGWRTWSNKLRTCVYHPLFHRDLDKCTLEAITRKTRSKYRYIPLPNIEPASAKHAQTQGDQQSPVQHGGETSDSKNAKTSTATEMETNTTTTTADAASNNKTANIHRIDFAPRQYGQAAVIQLVRRPHVMLMRAHPSQNIRRNGATTISQDGPHAESLTLSHSSTVAGGSRMQMINPRSAPDGSGISAIPNETAAWACRSFLSNQDQPPATEMLREPLGSLALARHLDFKSIATGVSKWYDEPQQTSPGRPSCVPWEPPHNNAVGWTTPHHNTPLSPRWGNQELPSRRSHRLDSRAAAALTDEKDEIAASVGPPLRLPSPHSRHRQSDEHNSDPLKMTVRNPLLDMCFSPIQTASITPSSPSPNHTSPME